MPKYILFIFCLLLVSALGADVRIHLNTENLNTILPTVTLENKNYISLEEINSKLGSYTTQELLEQKVHVTLYADKFIFLLNSPCYFYKSDLFNMHYPLLWHEDQIYLPEQFVTTCLPLHFPAKIEYKSGILSITKPEDKTIRTIVLDPGHGGKDPGAVGKNGTREKDINLSVALKLKKLLERDLGVRVLLTRSSDVFTYLGERTKFATNNQADIFISLHTNASANRSAYGIETYYLTNSMNTSNRAIEALENGVVDEYEGMEERKKFDDDLSMIISDMQQNYNQTSSHNLAFYVQKNMIAGLKGVDRGVKQANFFVLRRFFKPAILIEFGFISNLKEEQQLKLTDYQDGLAKTIYEGIKRFKHRYDRTRIE